MQTEMGTAGPWQGARPTEMGRGDSSGPLGKGEALLVVAGKSMSANCAAAWVARRFQVPLAFASTIAMLAELGGRPS